MLAVSKAGFCCAGQSGMGKSTTSRRWRAAGGSVPADDMVLLECGGEEVIAHPAADLEPVAANLWRGRLIRLNRRFPSPECLLWPAARSGRS